MALDAWMYRDPMEVVMRRQEAAAQRRKRKQEGDVKRCCAGCVHEALLHMPAGDVGRCELGHRYGWRCGSFAAKVVER